jgi:archaellum component FlaC
MPLYKNGIAKYEIEELKKRIEAIENDLRLLILEISNIKVELLIQKECINNLAKRIADIENNLKKD